jgi:hypothetical protein
MRPWRTPRLWLLVAAGETSQGAPGPTRLAATDLRIDPNHKDFGSKYSTLSFRVSGPLVDVVNLQDQLRAAAKERRLMKKGSGGARAADDAKLIVDSRGLDATLAVEFSAYDQNDLTALLAVASPFIAVK